MHLRAPEIGWPVFVGPVKHTFRFMLRNPKELCKLCQGLELLDSSWCATCGVVSGSSCYIAPRNAAQKFRSGRGGFTSCCCDSHTSRPRFPDSIWPLSAWALVPKLISRILEPWISFFGLISVVVSQASLFTPWPLPNSAGLMKFQNWPLLTCLLAAWMKSLGRLVCIRHDIYSCGRYLSVPWGLGTEVDMIDR